MTTLEVGQKAPSFRLPAGQGGDVAVEDYRGRRNVILWFTKGMACVFCRQQMSQLARGAPEWTARDAEIIQITPSTLERGRFYAKNFKLPFPYLCDPDYQVYRAYGLDVRPHSLAWKAQAMYAGMKMPKPATTDFGQAKPALGEFPLLMADDDTGLFILDKDGVVRYAMGGSYVLRTGSSPLSATGPRSLPSNEEIIRELERSRSPGVQ
jgi:peroxiredoxin